jgi:hypothetical protein
MNEDFEMREQKDCGKGFPALNVFHLPVLDGIVVRSCNADCERTLLKSLRCLDEGMTKLNSTLELNTGSANHSYFA